MSDLYVMGAVCSRNKVNERSLHKVDMTSDRLEMTLGKVGGTKGKSLASYVLYLATIKILFCVCLAHAGQRGVGNPAATGVALSTDSITPLKIGDAVPDALWNLPLQMVKAGQEGTTTVTLNDYKGNLIILDFWATWCTSCIKNMPHNLNVMDVLQDSIIILPVTKQTKELVVNFLSSNKILNKLNFSAIVEADGLNNYFPHYLVPHYVWISPLGELAAITSTNEITIENIRNLLNEKKIDYTSKIDVDVTVPLFLNTSVIPDNVQFMKYALFLRGYIPGLPAGSSVAAYNDSLSRLRISNMQVLPIQKLLLRKLLTNYSNKYVIYNDVNEADLAADSTLLTFDLVDNIGDDALHKKALNVLGEAASYSYEIKRITKRCYVVKGGIKDRLMTQGGKKQNLFTSGGNEISNSSIRNFCNWLNTIDSTGYPVLNETAIDYPIDLVLRQPFKSIEQIIPQLADYGLIMEPTERVVNVCVISKKNY